MSKYLAVLFKPYILFDIKVLKAIGRALMERIKFINQIENLDKKSDAFSLVGIGVKPEFLGKQVGSLLCKTFENNVYKNGFNSLRLSVYNHNLGARILKNGWKVKNKSGSIIKYYKSI